MRSATVRGGRLPKAAPLSPDPYRVASLKYPGGLGERDTTPPQRPHSRRPLDQRESPHRCRTYLTHRAHSSTHTPHHTGPPRSPKGARRASVRGHCTSWTGSRRAAIERGEDAGHAEDQRTRNRGSGRALRAAAVVASLCGDAARSAQDARHTEGMDCSGQRRALEMPSISPTVP